MRYAAILFLLAGCADHEQSKPTSYHLVIVAIEKEESPLVITDFHVKGGEMLSPNSVQMWAAWERQRRFALTKIESPVTGLLTLVIRDLWQKRVATIPGLQEEEYEGIRNAIIASIANGFHESLEWRREATGGVLEYAKPMPELTGAKRPLRAHVE